MKKQIEPPAGLRRLKDGEEIRAEDMVYNRVNLKFIPVHSAMVGLRYRAEFADYFRRK